MIFESHRAEISVFSIVSDGCLTGRVRGSSQVVLGECWQNLVSFRMHGNRQFICFLEVPAVAPGFQLLFPAFQYRFLGSRCPGCGVSYVVSHRA